MPVAGELIAVWSPKGGVGRTLIATGLAMHLVRRCDQPVLLADLHPENPSVAALLQTSGRPCILDYPSGSGRVVTHPNGLDLLPGPPRLVDEGLVTAELTEALLNRAQAAGYLVVADLSPNLRDSAVITLERAGAVLLITTPDLLSIYACRRFTQEADAIGMDISRFRLVINQASGHHEIPEREIVDLIGIPLAAHVPSLSGLAAAVNRGMISPTFRSNTDFAAAIHLVADSLPFEGIRSSAMVTVTSPLESKPVGLIPSLRRWWNSL